jgi:hypothetical protein
VQQVAVQREVDDGVEVAALRVAVLVELRVGL